MAFKSWPAIAISVPNTTPEVALKIEAEVKRSDKHGKTFTSMHEAYGVLLEEVDELWDICRLRKNKRTRSHIEEELIQIAAMAVKAYHSIDNFVEELK